MNIDNAYKTAKLVDNLMSKVTMVICLLLFFLAFYSLADNYMIYYSAQDKSMLKFKPGSGEASVLLLEVKDAVAWIELEDTPIDYPIMQGKDNNEYLNKNPLGEFSLAGSIFLDYRNDPEFKDTYSLVYGHHMEHDAMFGALDRYKDQEYFEKHREGKLHVGDTVYDVNIFAVVNCIASDPNIFNPYEFDLSSGYIQEHAISYKEPDQAGNYIALTTCAATPSEARLAVIGTLTLGGETNEEP